MKRTEFPGVANRLHLRKPSRGSLDRILSAICAIVRAVAADHALAQRAAMEAALPRKNLAEMRAMCVTHTRYQQNNERTLTPDGAQRAPAARRTQGDWPCWSSPFPKPKK